jgi:hypothetical protein
MWLWTIGKRARLWRSGPAIPSIGSKTAARGRFLFQACLQPILVNLLSSTWGGSMLKMRILGRGMKLQLVHPALGVITTSRIQEIHDLKPGSSGDSERSRLTRLRNSPLPTNTPRRSCIVRPDSDVRTSHRPPRNAHGYNLWLPAAGESSPASQPRSCARS